MRFAKPWFRTLSVLWFVCSCLAMEGKAQEQPAMGATRRVVFAVLPGAHGVIYKVNNNREADPLRGLGKAIERNGKDSPVICVIDSRLPVFQLGEASALAGKAGFKNVRIFALDHDTGKVSEVTLGPWRSTPQ